MKKTLFVFVITLNVLLGQNFEVDKSRIIDLFENLKKIGVNENEGNDRVAYSDFDIQARQYISKKLEQINAEVYTDFAGNLIAIYNPNNSSLNPISFGSHIDAVPNGGHYDGPVGVISAIEVLQTAHYKKINFSHPLELIIFSK